MKNRAILVFMTVSAWLIAKYAFKTISWIAFVSFPDSLYCNKTICFATFGIFCKTSNAQYFGNDIFNGLLKTTWKVKVFRQRLSKLNGFFISRIIWIDVNSSILQLFYPQCLESYCSIKECYLLANWSSQRKLSEPSASDFLLFRNYFCSLVRNLLTLG